MADEYDQNGYNSTRKTMKTGMVTIGCASDGTGGTEVIDPSTLQWSLSDISASDAGRDEKTTMHKMKLSQKRQYQIEWNHIEPDDAKTILQAVTTNETFYCRLYDPLQNSYAVGLYYVGDRSAPFKQWRDGTSGKLYTKVSFTLIEV